MKQLDTERSLFKKSRNDKYLFTSNAYQFYENPLKLVMYKT